MGEAMTTDGPLLIDRALARAIASILDRDDETSAYARELRALLAGGEVVEAGGCAPPVIASSVPTPGVVLDFALARAIASVLERDPETADYARELRAVINGGGE